MQKIGNCGGEQFSETVVYHRSAHKSHELRNTMFFHCVPENWGLGIYHQEDFLELRSL